MGAAIGLLSTAGMTRASSATVNKIYDKYFVQEKITDFQQFHKAFIEFCKFLNDICPGKNYEAPTMKEIEDFYEKKWKVSDNTKPDDKKAKFTEFMTKYVEEKKTSDITVIMAGLAVPAGAVMLKNNIENIPQVKRFKLHLVPNFIFVPTITLLGVSLVRFVQISNKTKSAKPEEGNKEKPQAGTGGIPQAGN